MGKYDSFKISGNISQYKSLEEEHGEVVKKEVLSTNYEQENDKYIAVEKSLVTYADNTTSNDTIKRYITKEEYLKNK